MKYANSINKYLIAGLVILISSCELNTGEPGKTDKYLYHPQKEEVELNGSVLIVDNGIMVLVQDGSLEKKPTILIPGTDSAGKTMRTTYDSVLSNSYKMEGGTYVKLAGNFLREDSIKPIFKFTWVEFMSKSDELKEIEQMEE